MDITSIQQLYLFAGVWILNVVALGISIDRDKRSKDYSDSILKIIWWQSLISGAFLLWPALISVNLSKMGSDWGYAFLIFPIAFICLLIGGLSRI